MAQIVPVSSIPPIPRQRVPRHDAGASLAAFVDLGQHHERFVVRLRDLLARVEALRLSDPALCKQLEDGVYWCSEYSIDELAGTLHAVEHAIAEVEVCLTIGTEQGLDALLVALGCEV